MDSVQDYKRDIDRIECSKIVVAIAGHGYQAKLGEWFEK